MHSKKFTNALKNKKNKKDCALKDVCVDSKNCANHILHTKDNLFERVDK